MNTYTVKVDAFEGPFDLLLYLVRNSKIRIQEISISEITAQFIKSVGSACNPDMASEFVFTAAQLLYLKSRILLPQEIDIDDDHEDERKEFIENLIEYQTYKNISHALKENLETGKILIRRDPQLIFDFKDGDNWEEISIVELILAFSRIAKELDKQAFKSIELEEISIEDKIDEIVDLLIENQSIPFSSLISSHYSKYELIISFLALLELVKMKKIYILQHKLFGSIKLVRREEI
jgi:segregation and condensation protein A